MQITARSTRPISIAINHTRIKQRDEYTRGHYESSIESADSRLRYNIYNVHEGTNDRASSYQSILSGFRERESPQHIVLMLVLTQKDLPSSARAIAGESRKNGL